MITISIRLNKNPVVDYKLDLPAQRAHDLLTEINAMLADEFELKLCSRCLERRHFLHFKGEESICYRCLASDEAREQG